MALIMNVLKLKPSDEKKKMLDQFESMLMLIELWR